MEATVLALIVASFACWCARQCFKPQQKRELEKRKDKDAWSEDMHRRFKDVDVSPTARNQANRQKSGVAPGSTRSGPSRVSP